MTNTSNLDYLLIDASSSMIDHWPRVLSSVNSYPSSLMRAWVPTQLTCAAFRGIGYDPNIESSGLGFTVLRNQIKVGAWTPISDTELRPDGGTPLNDAIAEALTRLEEQLKAQEHPKDCSVCLAIISDGGENESRTTTEQIRNQIQAKRELGWQIIFLGLNFDSESLAKNYGCEVETALNTNPRKLGAVFKLIAEKRKNTQQKLLFSATDKQDLKS